MDEMSEDVGALLDLERRRCEAIAASATEDLRGLLTDSYVHVHMNGAVDTLEGHLKAVGQSPRTPVRGEILVRVYDDLAVLTGPLDNHMVGRDGEPRVVPAYCQQVAVKQEGRWRFAAVQLTAKVKSDIH